MTCLDNSTDPKRDLAAISLGLFTPAPFHLILSRKDSPAVLARLPERKIAEARGSFDSIRRIRGFGSRAAAAARSNSRDTRVTWGVNMRREDRYQATVSVGPLISATESDRVSIRFSAKRSDGRPDRASLLPLRISLYLSLSLSFAFRGFRCVRGASSRSSSFF